MYSKIIPGAALILCLAMPFWVVAEEAPQTDPVPADKGAPPPPAVSSSDVAGEGDAIEPEVTIVERKGEVHEEYRVNGVLYMVKVQPKKGPPYYLVDMNGDGVFDSFEDDPTNNTVPRWVLFRW